MDPRRQAHRLIPPGSVRLWGVVLAGLCLRCAHVEPPPGGPVDAQPPRVIATFPAPGARNVASSAEMALKFSEWIDRNVGRRVFLSPPLPGKLKAEVEGDRLLIRPSTTSGGLQSNTAYRVTVLSSLQDLHGVAMGRPFSFAFTTGENFDSGSVSGRVDAPDRKGAVMVALYRTRGRDDSVGLSVAPWRELPSYMAAADSSGAFAFDSVSQGGYALLAYEDLNGNLAPDFGFDPMGVGLPDLRLTPHAPKQTVHLAPLDTSPLRISGVGFVADSVEGNRIAGALRVKFSRPPRPDSALALDGYDLTRLPGGEILSPIRIGWDSDSGAAILQSPPLVSGEKYRLRYSGVSDTGFSERTEFTASAEFDTSAWALKFLNSPDASGFPVLNRTSEIFPGKEYRLQSSRLLTQERWRVLEEGLETHLDTMPVKVELQYQSPVELTVRLAEPVRFGQTLRIRLRPRLSTLKKDSTNGTLRVLTSAKTLDSTQVGRLHFLIPERWKGWTFLMQAGQPPVEFAVRPDTSDSISIDAVRVGTYRLAAFLDRDGDGAWSRGSLNPWVPQEPYAVLLDSLRVAPGAATVTDLQ